jgi:TetR/AcrR family transcriptional regulator
LNKRAWGSAVQNREEIFDLKRTAVLNTAARLIKARGYENVSLVDIADELHIAKPTLYHYFKSKGELVRELFAIATTAFLDPAINPDDYPLAKGLTGAARLERFIRRAARVVTDDVGSSLVTLPLGNPELSAMQPNAQDVRRMAETIIRMGLEDGSLAPCDPETSYYFIVGALRYLPIWFAGTNRPLEEMSDALVHLVLRGIGSKAP